MDSDVDEDDKEDHIYNFTEEGKNSQKKHYESMVNIQKCTCGTQQCRQMSRLFYSLLKEEPARVRFRNAYCDQLINRANLNVKGFDQRVKVFHFNIQDRYLSINDRKNTDKQFKKESGEYILPSMDDTYWIKVKREIELAHKYLKSDPDKFKNQILPVLQGKTRDEATKIFFNTVQPKSSVDTYDRGYSPSPKS